MNAQNSTRSNWIWPRLLAHRGGGTLAPENTLAALRKGFDSGFRAVEFDVMLAADLVPVLMHDAELGRTVHACGSVSSTPSELLSGMDAGRWFGAAFAGEPVPLYADAMHYCRTHDLWMNVEIKPAPGFERITGEVVGSLTQAFYADRIAAMADAGATDVPLFSSFSEEALAGAREKCPAIPRGLLFDVVPPDWRERLVKLDCVTLHCNHAKLTAETARAVSAAGYGLLCYTVNTMARAEELFGWGVDAICTDRLDLFVQEQRSG